MFTDGQAIENGGKFVPSNIYAPDGKAGAPAAATVGTSETGLGAYEDPMLAKTGGANYSNAGAGTANKFGPDANGFEDQTPTNWNTAINFGLGLIPGIGQAISAGNTAGKLYGALSGNAAPNAAGLIGFPSESQLNERAKANGTFNNSYSPGRPDMQNLQASYVSPEGMNVGVGAGFDSGLWGGANSSNMGDRMQFSDPGLVKVGLAPPSAASSSSGPQAGVTRQGGSINQSWTGYGTTGNPTTANGTPMTSSNGQYSTGYVSTPNGIMNSSTGQMANMSTPTGPAASWSSSPSWSSGSSNYSTGSTGESFANGGQVGLQTGIPGGAPQRPVMQRPMNLHPDAAQGIIAKAGTNPQLAQMVQQAIQSGKINPQQLHMAAQLAQACIQNPALWPQLRQFAIQKGLCGPNDLPQQYDQKLVVAILSAAKAAGNMLTGNQQQGQQASMQPPPGMPQGNGGLLQGPGTGTSDSIPATNLANGGQVNVSSGEYVIPASVVQAKGKDFFDGLIRKYHQPTGYKGE